MTRLPSLVNHSCWWGPKSRGLAPHRNSWSCLTNHVESWSRGWQYRKQNETTNIVWTLFGPCVDHQRFLIGPKATVHCATLSSPDRIHIANLWGGAAQRLADAQGLHLLLRYDGIIWDSVVGILETFQIYPDCAVQNFQVYFCIFWSELSLFSSWNSKGRVLWKSAGLQRNSLALFKNKEKKHHSFFRK